MEYDAIIAGAGPAGLLAATKIAEDGYNVLVLEEHQRIGEPDHCAGLLSSSGLESLNLKPPEEAIQNLVSGARIFAPSGHSILIERGQREAFVIDRRRFDLWLSETARKKGVDIAEDAIKKGLKVLRQNPEEIKILVLPDGPLVLPRIVK